jgi:hypothetical protein
MNRAAHANAAEAEKELKAIIETVAALPDVNKEKFELSHVFTPRSSREAACSR